MNVRPLSDFIHAHYGRPALVIGGGMSAPKEIVRAPADCVVFSANQHGCILRPCDYAVACDEWGGTRNKKAKWPDGSMRGIREWGAPIISVRRADADIRIFEKPKELHSGEVAAWVAWIMGCAPIFAAGMDCYLGGTYFHDPKADSTGRHVQESNHVGRWRYLPIHAPDIMLRMLGANPVTRAGVFPVYDPLEPVRPPVRRDRYPGAMGSSARLAKPLKLVNSTLPAGEDLLLSDSELRKARVEGCLPRRPKERAAA